MDAGWTQIYIECKWTGPLLSQRTILDAIGLWCWDEIIFFLFFFLVNCKRLIVDRSLFGSAYSDHCSNNESALVRFFPHDEIGNWSLLALLQYLLSGKFYERRIRLFLCKCHLTRLQCTKLVHNGQILFISKMWEIHPISQTINYSYIPQKGNCKEFWQLSGQG